MMHPYFVLGQVTINVDLEVEADSLEDAKNKAIQRIKDQMIFDFEATLQDNFVGLVAEEFSDHDYSQIENENEI